MGTRRGLKNFAYKKREYGDKYASGGIYILLYAAKGLKLSKNSICDSSREFRGGSVINYPAK